jgi:urease accessory protein
MIRRVLPLLTGLAAAPGTALAHHAMGGEAPQTAWQGLLSGLAHPVIGLDHLAFVIATGVLAAGVANRRARIALPLVFLGAGLAGTLLHLAGIGLGPVELAIAASLLAGGGLLLRRDGAAPTPVLAALFAGAGLFHGHAFAEAAVGAETGPVLAYLIGLAGTQAAIAFGAMAVTRHMAAMPRIAPRRWAGIAACAIGAVAGVTAAMG